VQAVSVISQQTSQHVIRCKRTGQPLASLMGGGECACSSTELCPMQSPDQSNLCVILSEEDDALIEENKRLRTQIRAMHQDNGAVIAHLQNNDRELRAALNILRDALEDR
jgi:hypothetical protein